MFNFHTSTYIKDLQDYCIAVSVLLTKTALTSIYETSAIVNSLMGHLFYY